MRQREFEALEHTRNRELHCGVTTGLAVARVGAVRYIFSTRRSTRGSLFDRYPRQKLKCERTQGCPWPG